MSSPHPSFGFVKLQRTETTLELLRHKNAMHLLTVIALRARYADPSSLSGLSLGEAFIGDHEQYGMTRKEDRCARQKLEKWGLVTFRSSRAGTVARLVDSRVFSLRDERESPKKGQQEGQQRGHQFSEENSTRGAINGAILTADKGPTRGHHGASNQKEEKDRRNQQEGETLTQLPSALSEFEVTNLAKELDLPPSSIERLYAGFRTRKLGFEEDWLGKPRADLPRQVLHFLRLRKDGKRLVASEKSVPVRDYSRI